MQSQHRIMLLVLLVVCLLGLAAPALAQQPVVVRIDQVDVSTFPQVSLLVTVRNRYGGPISDLGPANFAVSEDDSLAPQRIRAVTPVIDPDAQLAVVLAIDVSGSMTGAKLRDAQEAARRFLDGLGKQDRVALLAFANSVDLQATDPAREYPFGQDTTPLYGVIDGLQAGGATPLYDTAFKAVQWAAQQPAGNRAVLLFTDGKEERAQDGSGGSRVANDDAPILEANKQGVPVFTIGLGDDLDETYLQRLALETGGTYQHARDSAELAQLFRNVSDLLKQQYRIDYDSGLPGDGAEHTVRVAVAVDEYEDFDQASLGVLPLIAEPVPTAEPTLDAAAEPLSTETPAADSVPTPELVQIANPADDANSGANRGPLGIALPWWLLIIAGIAALGTVGAYLAARRGNQEAPEDVYRCLRCGHGLPGKDAECPSCGYHGSYHGNA